MSEDPRTYWDGQAATFDDEPDHGLADPATREAWRQLLAAFAAQIREVDLEIINGPLAKPLHAASNGNLRALKRLLTYACMQAAERKESRVSAEDFVKAFIDAKGSTPDRVNPFLSYTEKRWMFGRT